MSLVPEKLVSNDGIEEIINCRKINHDNVISHVDDGSVTIDGVEYKFLVTRYFIGRLLSEFINEGKIFKEETGNQLKVYML